MRLRGVYFSQYPHYTQTPYESNRRPFSLQEISNNTVLFIPRRRKEKTDYNR